MRSLRRQLPGLLVIAPLAAPAYYIMFSYGRAPLHSLPRWAQLYMTTVVTLIGLALLAGLIAGIWMRVKERRFRRARTAATVVHALSPGSAADESVRKEQNWRTDPTP